MRKLIWLLPIAAGLLAGCSSDDSMSSSVKPNPAMANRFKRDATGGPTPPAGVAATPPAAGK